MTGLSKITDKILDGARRDAAEKLAAADAESKRISDEYKKKAEAIVSAANARAKSEAEDIISRTRSGEAALRKNLLLKTQGDMIDRAFEVAYNELVALSGNERLELLTGLLTASLSAEWEAEQSREEIYGAEEQSEGPRVYEVLLNAKDREHYKDSLIDNFKRRIVGKDLGDLPGRVKLSRDTVDIEGGLIIRVGSVEINNSFAAIISQLRPALEVQVAKILFPA